MNIDEAASWPLDDMSISEVEHGTASMLRRACEAAPASTARPAFFVLFPGHTGGEGGRGEGRGEVHAVQRVALSDGRCQGNPTTDPCHLSIKCPVLT